MSIFQQSVLTKYLDLQDKENIALKWTLFKQHFHNADIQENIRNSKEEQYQEGFLTDLFVNVLGYIKNPTPNYNLTTEYKNIKDSKKADGAIIINEKVKAVIELKGTNTTDLSKIEAQAFGYKNNQTDCVYVITSNFEKLRFYIDNAVEYIEFNLFKLSEEDFQLLYLCLAYVNIDLDIPKKLKEDSLSQENIITKKLYKDYSSFKTELYNNLILLNPQYEALELFKKSQKLLDRFLFIFFAEDRQLLPPNSIRQILDQWEQLKELDAEVPLYDRYKKYFNYLNTGFKGKHHDIFAYNGGLFKPDEILDNIIIDDNLLAIHTSKISDYDFASEIDVNILGHIFENSLNQLDEITNVTNGLGLTRGLSPLPEEETTNSTRGLSPLLSGKEQTKRKKDGVFYTPKYITKYIVENTVGKLCTEKKAEFKIIEEDYFTDKKRNKVTKQRLLEQLTDYRKWLLQITICDPACGSGAFLNEALNFLINEHKYIDELQSKLFGDTLLLSDVENSILEHNLFGVDINEESVDIAKLSLWLRTARPNRKLNNLSNNIKCGNSLIDDPAIAGEKAFDWHTAFPQVFKEKSKKAWHITTAIHDSRTSQRMIDYKVREKRAKGTMPEPQINYLTDEDEMVIAKTVELLTQELKLNILAFNICNDHMHLILVCDEIELNEIVRKIKGRTSREVNKNRGDLTRGTTRGLSPLPKGESSLPGKEIASSTRGLSPLPLSEEEKSIPLWTQKFGSKEIIDEKQLSNAVEYVQQNRTKHNLPAHSNKGFKPLVEGISCTYDHAFRVEYTGGFDVVIGNPPYVQVNQADYSNIKTKKCSDLYAYFFEKGTEIVKVNGVLSYITPSSYFTNLGFITLREYLLNYNIEKLVDLGKNVFEDASVDSGIIVIKKEITTDNKIQCSDNSFVYSNIDKSVFNLLDNKIFNIYIKFDSLKIAEKIALKSVFFDELIDFSRGVEFGFKSKNVFDTQIEGTFPILCGGNISRYRIDFENKFVNYDEKMTAIYKSKTIYYEDKILVRRIGNKIVSCFDNSKYFNVCDVYNLQVKKSIKDVNLKYVSVFLNSKIINFYFDTKFKSVKTLFPKIPIQNLKLLPIIILSLESQQPFIEKAELMLSLNKELQEQSQKFQRTLQRKFFNIDIDMGLNKGLKPLAVPSEPLAVSSVSSTPLTKKLQNWFDLSYAEFIKELEKQKVKLSLAQEAEWEEYFLTESSQVNAIKNKINETDKQIDNMVYELYGLSEEEIAIVEGV